MKRFVTKILLCLPALSTAAAGDAARDKSATPAERYAALLKQYTPVAGALRKAKTDRQRTQAVERLGKFAAKFLELAEKNPKHPIALQALRQAVQAVASTDSAAQIAWEMNRGDFPKGISDGTAGRIVAVVLRDHARSDRLGPVVDRLRYGYRMEFATCLSTIERTSPHKKIRAVACLALARFLNDRLRMRQLAEDQPALTKRYAALFGNGYLTKLRQPKLAKRIETLFERAAKYGDVKMPYGGTVGEQARSELYEIRRLGIGKVAPEIAGKDQDGQPLKLSDYRGRVVLLYFWMEF